MAHNPKKQSTGSWKGNRDTHQKTDHNRAVKEKRESKPNWTPRGGKKKS